MTDEHLPVFVYGTLQRGEERADRWPRVPRHVEWGTIRGRIHDLGPYPGLVAGDDVVMGELWHLAAEDLVETLVALDQIECSGQDNVDLYVRRVVECRTLTGFVHRCYTYFFADEDAIRDKPVVRSDERGYCHWRKKV